MAAAYVFHIVRNHPFMDGNKRAGAASGLAFLRLNGVRISHPKDKLAERVLSVAQSTAGKPEIAAFFRAYTTA